MNEINITDSNNSIYNNEYIKEINIKFIIFLTDINLKKKKYGLFGKTYQERLYNKGVYAVNFYKWKDFFVKNNISIPKFDINDESPSHGIVYKKFTDKQYLNIHNFSNYQFQEQSRALSTLVGILGAKKVEMKLINKNNKSISIKQNIQISDEVNINIGGDKQKKKEDNQMNIKEFLPIVNEKFFYSNQKFHSCAKNDGLFGVDSGVYKQMKFENIVSERYSGQLKSYYIIYKKLYTKDSIEIGAFINKLNIGMNTSFESIKEKTEIYTFIIEYYTIEELTLKNYKRIINNDRLKKRIEKNKYSSSDSDDNSSITYKKKSRDTNIYFLSSDSYTEYDTEEDIINTNTNTNTNTKNYLKLNNNLDNSNIKNINLDSSNCIINNLDNSNCIINNLDSSYNIDNYNNINNELNKSDSSDKSNSFRKYNKSKKHHKKKHKKRRNSKNYKNLNTNLSIANLSEFTYDIVSKKYKNNPSILNKLINTDTKIECDEEVKINNIINKCKLNKNIDSLKKYIINYAKQKGLHHNLDKWKNKDKSNILDERCQWFNCKYDIDNFLEKL